FLKERGLSAAALHGDLERHPRRPHRRRRPQGRPGRQDRPVRQPGLRGRGTQRGAPGAAAPAGRQDQGAEHQGEESVKSAPPHIGNGKLPLPGRTRAENNSAPYSAAATPAITTTAPAWSVRPLPT